MLDQGKVALGQFKQRARIDEQNGVCRAATLSMTRYLETKLSFAQDTQMLQTQYCVVMQLKLNCMRYFKVKNSDEQNKTLV